MSTEEFLGLPDLQIAGLGWFCYHAIFKRNSARLGKERIRLCNGQALLRDPHRAVAGFFGHFDIWLTDEDGRRIAHGEAFRTNSKNRSPYFGATVCENWPGPAPSTPKISSRSDG